MSFTIDNWMVCWQPKANHSGLPAVKVGAWPDKTGWSKDYVFSDGCCFFRRGRQHAEKVARMFIDFHTVVVRDGVAPEAAHREFLKIDAYRESIAPDCGGGG